MFDSCQRLCNRLLLLQSRCFSFCYTSCLDSVMQHLYRLTLSLPYYGLCLCRGFFFWRVIMTHLSSDVTHRASVTGTFNGYYLQQLWHKSPNTEIHQGASWRPVHHETNYSVSLPSSYVASISDIAFRPVSPSTQVNNHKQTVDLTVLHSAQ